MFDKIFDYITKNTNKHTLRYTAGTLAIIYILSNFPPRPPNNPYLLRKY
jgi:hypothetical protein